MASSRTPRSATTPVGRPRDTHIDLAILEAALALLDKKGYAGLVLEEVARQAETTKPAIYRRWGSRQNLALAALGMRLEGIQTPDTGCTICDLNEGLNIFVAAFQRIRPEILGPLHAACAAEPELHRTFMTTLFEPPRRSVLRMLETATARGDLRPDLDIELVLDMLGSLVHYRALFGHAALETSDVENAVAALLSGIATDYPALVEHSRELAGASPVHAVHA
ncbi:MAG: TetR/AcrR family transcriptional regulator [Corynebacteriales bacterium]|nr:TetR/AcrR family transcriptional regulator [Mycobacteriales bacterium]